MNLVLFTHPEFLGSQSMPRFARGLASAFQARGHPVELRTPQARLRHLLPNPPLAKWAGYVDQYLLFPRAMAARLRSDPPDTLYVFCDQALGPWVPRVAHRPHVVFCHDLLALKSALGQVPENPTGFTGRIYQRYIRRGFRQGRHFISISERSRSDLHTFGGVRPVTSEVVYQGLTFPYAPMAPALARQQLEQAGLPAAPHGLLLHVSGGQWYKNVPGVVRLYAHYAAGQAAPLPLWLVGGHGAPAVQAALAEVPPQGRVHLLGGLSNTALQAAYASARAFIFPSLGEGFGLPIVEAQACGCPVLTTDEAPMTEAAGPAAVLLPRLQHGADMNAWAAPAAQALAGLLAEDDAARAARAARCTAWAARFTADAATDRYLQVFAQVLAAERAAPAGAATPRPGLPGARP